ncbi:hypothetical protein KFZ70_05770 [Tamlana fucoidanivorans]|uniref:Porin family protein n=1 Tax=Allotamlana fucoidanivorans TaxID=2583814 RepID=A0A5C4SRC2_9FLAO|nr:DUF6646 family protein [Tamlana fucoidanivorans]TNJ46986.1 hypothetical protein FGF67_00215 [Tamlana fucoidanivorans]
MKHFALLVAVFSITLASSQAYIGANDNKFQVGVNLQNHATGIHASYDFGLGENISVGVSSTYALGVNENIDADFGDRFDVRGRFNANLGNVINVDENFDLYPGLSLGLRNFGGHLGARYFFSSGFGLYTEFGVPLAKYKTGDLTPAQKLNNQFNVNIGASFSL